MNFKRAWKCHDCPESNNERGCPCWVEFLVTNNNGQEEWQKNCLFQALPFFLIETIKAANRPAAAFESLRNEHLAALANLQESLVQAVVMAHCNRALPFKGEFTDASAETYQEGEHPSKTEAMGAR